jgi:hypothetical protein
MLRWLKACYQPNTEAFIIRHGPTTIYPFVIPLARTRHASKAAVAPNGLSAHGLRQLDFRETSQARDVSIIGRTHPNCTDRS